MSDAHGGPPLSRAARRARGRRPRSEGAASPASAAHGAGGADPTGPQAPGSAQRGRRIARRVGAVAMAALLLALAIPPVLALPAVTEAFPERVIAGCQMGEPVESWGKRRMRALSSPLRNTSCGPFRARATAACTSDPGRGVQLIPGTRYDLVVQGANLPGVSRPRLVSAQLSADQGPPGPERFAELDALTDALLAELEPEQRAALEAQQEERLAEVTAQLEQFAPERLRAFDYAQPPFDPECDVSRRVMTSIGVQTITQSARAAELLSPPAGETPRDPLLPCDDPLCTVPPQAAP